MKYINAKFLLPDALVKELQHYIQGGYLYIPTDQTQQKCWGEKSGYRQNCSSETAGFERHVGKAPRWSTWQSSTVCLSMPSGKSSTKNNRRGSR